LPYFRGDSKSLVRQAGIDDDAVVVGLFALYPRASAGNEIETRSIF